MADNSTIQFRPNAIIKSLLGVKEKEPAEVSNNNDQSIFAAKPLPADAYKQYEACIRQDYINPGLKGSLRGDLPQEPLACLSALKENELIESSAPSEKSGEIIREINDQYRDFKFQQERAENLPPENSIKGPVFSTNGSVIIDNQSDFGRNMFKAQTECRKATKSAVPGNIIKEMPNGKIEIECMKPSY